MLGGGFARLGARAVLQGAIGRPRWQAHVQAGARSARRLAEFGRARGVRSASSSHPRPGQTQRGSGWSWPVAAAAAAAAVVLGYELAAKRRVNSQAAAAAQAQDLIYSRSEVVSARPSNSTPNQLSTFAAVRKDANDARTVPLQRLHKATLL